MDRQELARVPELLLRAKRGEAWLADDVVDERGDAPQLDVRRLAKLTEVREAAVDLLRILVLLAQNIVGAYRMRRERLSTPHRVGKTCTDLVGEPASVEQEPRLQGGAVIEGTLQSQLGYLTLAAGVMRYVNPNKGCAAYLAGAIAIHQCFDERLAEQVVPMSLYVIGRYDCRGRLVRGQS